MLRSRLNISTALDLVFICISNTASWAKSPIANENRNNNPLNLAAPFNVQHCFAPGLTGASTHANDFLLRPAVAPGSYGLVPPQMFRMTLSTFGS
jgi:hypothetical protein